MRKTMLKYKITFIEDSGFHALVQHHEIESETSLSLLNPIDRDFILRQVKIEYKGKIRLMNIKQVIQSALFKTAV